MKRTDLHYLLLIIVIFISACIETDIYLPAFPDMMTFFSVTEEEIQALLTWNFFGVCVAGPIYGPLSDAVGRKKPLLCALGIFFIGSLITLFAHNFFLMLIGRLLQGLGSGGCFTLGSAIIFDAFQETKAILVLNQLNTIIPIIMAGAPLAGSYLNQTFGFRSNFLIITILVLLSLVVSLFWFKETFPSEKRVPLNLKKIKNDFCKVLTNTQFWQLTTVVSLTFAAYIAFLSATSLLFILEFNVSTTLFPWFQVALLGVWVFASLCMSHIITLWGVPRVKMIGLILIILGGFTFGISTLVAPESPYFVTLGMMFFAFGTNWIQGFYFVENMDLFPEIKGITASLVTSLRLLITAIIVGLVSAFYDRTIYPIACVVLTVIGISLFLIITYERSARHLSTTDV